MNKSAIVLMLSTLGLTAHAQVAYRCGNAYSQDPCPQARAVDVSDQRTDAQRADALRVAAVDRQWGDEMSRERLARESSAKPAHAKPTKAKRPRVSKIKWFRP